MYKLPLLEELLRLNPKINERQLNQLREQLHKLRETRSHKKGYRLASPITRRRIVVGDKRQDRLRNTLPIKR